LLIVSAGGAEPSALPVQAPVKLELVINLEAVNSFDVPLQLRQCPDEAIE